MGFSEIYNPKKIQYSAAAARVCHYFLITELMDITWYGYSCFSLKTKDGSLVIDPYKDVGLKLPNLKPSAVIISDENTPELSAAAVGDSPKVLTWAGEYEVAGIAITAMMHGASAEEKKGAKKAMIYTFDADGLKVCYISDMSVPINDDLMESIGDVDVLMVPVGKGKTNIEEIHTIIEEIEPRIVIPVFYKTPGLKAEAGDLEPFLKKTGLKDVSPKDKFTVNTRSELPQEKTEFVILAPQNA